MNQYGHGGPLDFEIAWKYYQAAAKNGERRAWNNLGYMLSNGQG
jgi:TPR repeat protein